MTPNKTANLSVQISARLAERLKIVAEQTRLPVNAIARMAIEAAVEMIERDGGIFLPLQYKRHQAPLDLRLKSKRTTAKKQGQSRSILIRRNLHAPSGDLL